MWNQKARRRPAFTLIELLVVIAIIGILIALLLPAVQAAREAARRAQCSNNFKQVGLALHNYHSALETFPPGMILYYPGVCPGIPTTGPNYLGASWSTFILPYMEHGSIYDQIDFAAPFPEYVQPSWMKAGSNRISSYECPSDPNSDQWVEIASGRQSGPNPVDDFRQINMCGVADSVDKGCGNYFWVTGEGDGVFFNVKPVRLGKIADGSSQTLAVGEYVGAWGQHPDEGKAYMGSFYIAWNVQDTALGINGFGSVPGGRNESLDPIDGDGGNRHLELWDEVGFASWHPGGCHFLMADGSVQFLKESIDQSTLAYLTTRDGGDLIPEGY
jgi:prepilin-type N-terminal cleavage/methylation domain-containing protein/prepilin-type processing-associated H-X9-DG protein